MWNVRTFVTDECEIFFVRTYVSYENLILPNLCYCLADHGQTIQLLVKCGRLLQIFLPLFSWKTIVNLNNQSGFQYLTEWLLIYFFSEIGRVWKLLPHPSCRARTAEPEFFWVYIVCLGLSVGKLKTFMVSWSLT